MFDICLYLTIDEKSPGHKDIIYTYNEDALVYLERSILTIKVSLILKCIKCTKKAEKPREDSPEKNLRQNSYKRY